MLVLLHLIETVGKHHRRQLAERQLRRMPPHLLNDIGIEPHRLEEAVDGLLAGSTKPASAQPPTKRQPGHHAAAGTGSACC